MDRAKTQIGTKIRGSALTAILVALALVGPVVAYAGVSVVWPASTKTVNVNQDPPIRFKQGDDYTLAKGNNFTSAWAGQNANASYTITVSGLSGGNVTVDKLVRVEVDSNVQDFNVSIESALSGTFDNVNISRLKIRLWNGTTEPAWDADESGAADGAEGIRCVLDLKGAKGSSTGGVPASHCERPGEGFMHMQLLFALADDQSVEESTVSIQPLDVAFA